MWSDTCVGASASVSPLPPPASAASPLHLLQGEHFPESVVVGGTAWHAGLGRSPVCSEVMRVQLSLGRVLCAGTDSWLHSTGRGALGAQSVAVRLSGASVPGGVLGGSLCWPQPLQTLGWQGMVLGLQAAQDLRWVRADA